MRKTFFCYRRLVVAFALCVCREVLARKNLEPRGTLRWTDSQKNVYLSVHTRPVGFLDLTFGSLALLLLLLGDSRNAFARTAKIQLGKLSITDTLSLTSFSIVRIQILPFIKDLIEWARTCCYSPAVHNLRKSDPFRSREDLVC